MTMQRRHFELIAETISTLPNLYMDEPISKRQTYEIARVFAQHLNHTNPNFNRARFLRACGVSED